MTLSKQIVKDYWIRGFKLHVVVAVWAFLLGWFAYKDAGHAFWFGVLTALLSFVTSAYPAWKEWPEGNTTSFSRTYIWTGFVVGFLVTLIGGIYFGLKPLHLPVNWVAALYTAAISVGMALLIALVSNPPWK